MTEEEGKSYFGKELKSIRTNRNLSYRELAEIIDLSAVYISDLEKNNRVPTKKVITKILNNLNLSEEEQLKITRGFQYARPDDSIPIDILYYILENDLIDDLRILETDDKEGTKIKKLAKSKNESS